MPPIVKDAETLAATETAARPGSAQASSDSGARQQPVALEVPVSVNGARTIAGSDKREPFSETTKTVLVHGAGAVIRLTSAVSPGQLLFLTNERTKKEVVCQVVKSKNYRSGSGYVELEFTEPAVGFWGMRFPGDHRVTSAPQAAPVRAAGSSGSPAPPRPVATKNEQPPANNIPGAVATKSVAPAPVAQILETRPAESKLPTKETPAYSKTAAPVTPISSFVPSPIDSASLLGAPKAKPATESELVEPWLKKPARLVVPPNTAVPEVSAKSSAPETSLPTAPTFPGSSSPDQAASIFAPSEPSNQVKVDLSKVDLASLAPFFEVKPAASVEVLPAVQPASAKNAETEELKQHTARLQEELSQLNFAEDSTSTAKPMVELPSAPRTEELVPFSEGKAVHEKPAQILESSNASNTETLLADSGETSKHDSPAPLSALEALEQEELKIPAWLEPLARNASAPSSTQELVLREKSKRKAEHTNLEEVTAELAAPVKAEPLLEARVPQFGSTLTIDEVQSREAPARKSGKGMVLAAIAAGVLAAAYFSWSYLNQQSAGGRTEAPGAQTPAITAPSQNSQAGAPKETATDGSPSADSGAVTPEAPATKPHAGVPANSKGSVSNAPAGGSVTGSRGAQGNAKGPNMGSVVTASVSTPAPRETAAVAVEVKKPSLGEVHLATPKISQNRKAQSSAEGDAGISLNDEEPGGDADALGAGLAVANNQPAAPAAAPAAVGGDVKQAKLLSAVQPVYPALAKTQRVSGSVTIDALIDANGRVTATKIISGPALLQQAAVEALRQWKYQPATLDGKPVAMHLSVTIQFRLQ